jgi:uncharacterized glyoxalase superfamily protein PhnB
VSTPARVAFVCAIPVALGFVACEGIFDDSLGPEHPLPVARLALRLGCFLACGVSFAIAGTGTFRAWRWTTRLRAGLCPTCGYDLRAHAGGERCPECGSALARGEESPMKSDFPGPVPEIPVREIAAAAAYYQNNLGFTLDWGDEDLGLAGISKGNCRMFLANPRFREQYGNAAPTLTWLNLDSKAEVDELYRTWSASNAKLVSAPESKPWGLHEFTAADPDGNLFRVFYDFATPERAKDA